MHSRLRGQVIVMWLMGLVSVAAPAQAPLGTTFTYQGLLSDGSVPVNTPTDFAFSLWDSAVGGNQIGGGGAIFYANAIQVDEGLFSVEIDAAMFGPAAFAGDARWLQVSIRNPAGGGPYVLLSPRQAVTAAPYGLYSVSAANADKVDGLHANAAPTANTLLPLDASTKFPNSVLRTGAGNGLDADLLDGQQGAFYQNAGNLNAGTLPDARLSGNVALLNNVQTFSGAKTFSAAPSFTAAGAPFTVTGTTVVTNLNADLLDGQTGSFYQNASNLNTGTLSDARLSSNVALLNTVQTFSANKFFSGVVGIGVGSSSYPLSVSNPTNSFGQRAIYGLADTSGTAQQVWGIFGQTMSTATTNPGAGLMGYASASTGSSAGVRGESAGTSGTGVFGYATASTGTTYGVRAIANSSGGYAGHFSGRGYFSDNVGIGTENPSAPLHITANYGGSGGMIWAVNGQTGTNDTPAIYGEHATTDWYGIGVRGRGLYRGVDGFVSPTGSNSYTGVYGNVSGGSGSNYGVYGYASGSGTNYGVVGQATGGATNYAGYFAGTVYVTGTTNTDVLTIRGGADLAEKFDVTEEVKPGMVVAIDPEHTGKMCVARGAYNARVAGVISGANELATGMVLGEFEGAENAHPVALSGRVWTYCAAGERGIEPGDLLTTAERPGYAMPVVDRARAHGAVIGKAMSRLAKGEEGLVLVLVNLQ